MRDIEKEKLKLEREKFEFEKELKKELKLKEEYHKKNETHPLAVGCAFFCGIFAQLLKGHIKKFAMFFCLNTLALLLCWIIIGFPLCVVLWIIELSDAYYSNNPNKINIFEKEY